MVLGEEQNAFQLHTVSVFPFVKAFSLISLWAISLLSGNNLKMSKSLIKIDVKRAFDFFHLLSFDSCPFCGD